MTIDSIIEKKRISILVGIITLAIILQLYNLGNRSLWLDEVWSFKFASMNLMEILGSPDKPNPPLYYTILHFFLKFGKDEFTLRLPSVIAGISCIPLVYKVGSDFFNHRVGLLSAFLLATSPFFYWHAQEARCYTLFTLFSLLSLIFFYNALRTTDAAIWIGFIISTSLGIYTHYYAFFLILIEFSFMMVFINRYKLFISKFFLSSIAIIILILPQIMSLFTGMSSKLNDGSSWGMPPSLIFVPDIFCNLSKGYVIYSHWFIVFIFLIFLYGFFHSYLEQKEVFGLSAIWIFAPIIISFLLAFKINVDVRYFIFILPIYLIVISKGLLDIGKRHFFTFIFLFLILCTSNAYLLHASYNNTIEDWRSVASLIKGVSLQGDYILCEPKFLENCLIYYDINPNMILESDAKNGEDLRIEIQRILQGTKRLWIPYTGYIDDKKNILLNWLNDNSIRKYEFRQDIMVYLCEHNLSTNKK
jgi:mannosyltransferase